MIDFVVARALKKDPAVRYQNARDLAADLATCLAELRGQQPAEERSAEGSRTLKMETSPDKAPAARAIAFDTRLQFSRLIDSAAAVKRIKAAKGDITDAPRSVGLLRRIVRDGAVRELVIVALVAGCAGVYIALL